MDESVSTTRFKLKVEDGTKYRVPPQLEMF